MLSRFERRGSGKRVSLTPSLLSRTCAGESRGVKPWTDIREADKFSLACTQLSEGWNARDAAASGEDCLYLNVAAPEWPPKAKRPMFVWIHGGSNTAGSGIAAGFDQRTLVKRGLVLVTINYRMGALG